MKRSIHDIRDNLDYVGCDDDTARELCDEVQRLQTKIEKLWADNDALIESNGALGVSIFETLQKLDECRRLLREAWTASCQNTILPRAWAEQTLGQITAAKAGGEA